MSSKVIKLKKSNTLIALAFTQFNILFNVKLFFYKKKINKFDM